MSPCPFPTSITIIPRAPPSMCVCVCVRIYICMYIYIYLLIYYQPAFTVTKNKKIKKERKETVRNKRQKYVESPPGGKKKKCHRTKRKKRPTPSHQSKKSRDVQSVGQKKTKTCRKHCNATITRVLNKSGANYKINLNRESEFSY